MEQLLIKGYVTPADCGGCLQAALDKAAALGIRKVVVEEDYTASKPLTIPENMYIVLKNCVVTADLIFDGGENYSFCKKWLTVEGENGTLRGSLKLFNTAHVNICGIALDGELSLEYTNWCRLEHIRAADGSIRIGRGCNNFIVQSITSKTIYVCGDHSCGRIVPGSKPEVTNIVVQDCEADIHVRAETDCGVLNIQADHITGGVCVGCPDKPLPAEQFMNLTFTNLTGQVKLHNPVKHAYIK